MMRPPAYLQNLIETTFNTRTKDWTRPDCGLSATHRFSVQLGDGSKIFVKAATDAMTESWLRNEHRALSVVRGRFMPEVVAWMEEPGRHPVLVTEDLSRARWPASHAGVSWENGDMELLMEVLREIAAIENTGDLPAIKNQEQNAWVAIAADPEAFLGLKVCSASWFDRNVTALAEAERVFDQTGNHLVHGDVRSDNICFAGSQVILVDWSHAARGHARCDIGNLLPTLHLEGGPKPFTLMPDGAGAASFACARLIERLNHDGDLPGWLKAVFVKLIGIELEWAADCLGLDQPDGAARRPV